jgi:GNAT superfamily N-acetyltransferase
MPQVAVTTYYLEMLDPRELRPKRSTRADLSLALIDPPMPELNRFFYTTVGANWYWHDRLPWTFANWRAYLARPELQTWMIAVKGTPAGYFELERQPQGEVEICYFGLLPAFVGAGLGGHLLTCAIERGFAMGAKRLWVHTCTLDHPQALANYQARGMRLYKQETQTVELTAEPSGPWPGALAPG